MTIAPTHIDIWRAVPSGTQRLEFKQARHQFDTHKLCRYCVAIANEGGGHLLLGIADKPPRDVYHQDGAYLMRSGEELVPMSEDQLRKIFAEGQPGWLENPALKDVSSQDVIQLLDTQTFFDLLKLPYPTEQAGVLARLLDERLIDRSAAGFHILHMAAVPLAKNLRHFPDVCRKAIRVIVYAGESRMQTVSDVTIETGSCYQHCVLQYVLRKQMTNQSLRDRFGLSEGSSNTVSQIITMTIEQGLIKSDPHAPDSRRYARYIPAWA